jgi:hypothetical protein
LVPTLDLDRCSPHDTKAKMSVESSVAAPGASANVNSQIPSTSGVTWEEKKVLAATLVGTTIEWYDFFVYAQAAGLAFVPLFFSPMTQNNPLLAQIISFATIGLSSCSGRSGRSFAATWATGSAAAACW